MNKFFVIAFAAVLLSSCAKTPPKSDIPPLKVECTESKTRSLNDQIWFSSSTRPLYSVTIEPRVNGYLEAVKYQSGRAVKQGEKIFEIDPSQLNTSYYAASAELESAKASLIEAENNYLRAVPLARINAISQSSLDQYTATHAAAIAEVKSAEESLRNAELNLSYSSIKAPIDGVIAETESALGDYVGPGTKFSTLTTISYVDTLELYLAIPTSQYLKYSDHTSYDNANLLDNITLILSDSTTYPHRAKYSYTKRDVTSLSASIVIVANIPNPDGLLKPNMFARLRADIGQSTERVVVPQSAVTQMQGSSWVWVISPDSTAQLRMVKLGDTFGDEWQIKSGLKSGEMVATSTQIKLHEGAKVTPIYSKK